MSGDRLAGPMVAKILTLRPRGPIVRPVSVSESVFACFDMLFLIPFELLWHSKIATQGKAR
jgi:hypothetical protein